LFLGSNSPLSHSDWFSTVLSVDFVLLCDMMIMSGGISVLQYLVSNLCRRRAASHWPRQGYKRWPPWYQDYSETWVSNSLFIFV